MKEISVQKSFEFFKDTLNHIGLFLFNSTDEEIGYNLFEEFDTDCISFLHEKTLKSLLDAKLISQKVFDMSLDLAIKFRAFEKTDLWNVESVRTSERWLETLTLSDEIKSSLEKQ